MKEDTKAIKKTGEGEMPKVSIRMPAKMKHTIERMAITQSEPGAIKRFSNVLREMVENSPLYQTAVKQQKETAAEAA